MQLCTFTLTTSEPRLGAISTGAIIDLQDASRALDGSAAAEYADMVSLFAGGITARHRAEDLVHRATGSGVAAVATEDAHILAPVPRPRRIRDYLTYRQHANGSGITPPPAFEAMPISYQCNVESVVGPDAVIPWPAYTNQLDYELEIGFFVGPGGRDITVGDAPSHIAGITLFNDVSARDIQFFEMGMSIGPSKGKSFCNVMGPTVLTIDEVDEFAIDLSATVNGEVWSHGTSADRQFSFAEVLAWASYAEDVYPGEFLAVGTVGGGCGLENGHWLQPGDVLELEATGVGIVRNTIGERQQPSGAGIPSYRGAPRFEVPAHH